MMKLNVSYVENKLSTEVELSICYSWLSESEAESCLIQSIVDM